MKAREMSGWAYFDRVYCISLEERPDRRAEATAQFTAVGLLSRVEFVIVKKRLMIRNRGFTSPT